MEQMYLPGMEELCEGYDYASIKKAMGELRRGLFARHGEMQKRMAAVESNNEALRREIVELRNELRSYKKQENIECRLLAM